MDLEALIEEASREHIAAVARHVVHRDAARAAPVARDKMRLAEFASIAGCQARSWKRWADAYRLLADTEG